MNKKLLIFGTHEIADLAYRYFKDTNEYSIEAFIVDDAYKHQDVMNDIPVIPYSEVKEKFKPKDFKFHIAISFKQFNQLREKIYQRVKKDGYEFESYISPNSTILTKDIGDNVFILENQTIQHDVKIGNNVVIWSSNHIGHGSIIEDSTYISSHVVISGHVSIGKRSFIGVNSAVKDFCKIGSDCFISMGSNVTSNLNPGSIVLPQKSEILNSKDRRAKFIIKKYFFS